MRANLKQAEQATKDLGAMILGLQRSLESLDAAYNQTRQMEESPEARVVMNEILILQVLSRPSLVSFIREAKEAWGKSESYFMDLQGPEGQG